MKKKPHHQQTDSRSTPSLAGLAGLLLAALTAAGCVTTKSQDELSQIEGRLQPRVAQIRGKDSEARMAAAEERATLAAIAQLNIALPEPDFSAAPDAVPQNPRFTPRGGQKTSGTP
jgi:hypothetical protein